MPQIKNILHSDKILWGFFIFIGALLLWWSQPTPSAKTETVSPADAQTYIPKNHLLIPIEIKNSERLNGLMGSAGVVDLYQAGTEIHPKSELVGRRFRLIRAPLNPESFAVLIRDEEADHLASFPGPFIASLRSDQSKEHEIAKHQKSAEVDYQ